MGLAENVLRALNIGIDRETQTYVAAPRMAGQYLERDRSRGITDPQKVESLIYSPQALNSLELAGSDAMELIFALSELGRVNYRLADRDELMREIAKMGLTENVLRAIKVGIDRDTQTYAAAPRVPSQYRDLIQRPPRGTSLGEVGARLERGEPFTLSWDDFTFKREAESYLKGYEFSARKADDGTYIVTVTVPQEGELPSASAEVAGLTIEQAVQKLAAYNSDGNYALNYIPESYGASIRGFKKMIRAEVDRLKSRAAQSLGGLVQPPTRPADFGRGDYEAKAIGGIIRHEISPFQSVEARKIQTETLPVSQINRFALANLTFRLEETGVREYALSIFLDGKWSRLDGVTLKEGVPLILKRGYARMSEVADGRAVDLEGEVGTPIPRERYRQVDDADGEWRIIAFGQSGTPVYLPRQAFEGRISRGAERTRPRPGYDVGTEQYIPGYLQTGHVEIQIIGGSVKFSDLGSSYKTEIEVRRDFLKDQGDDFGESLVSQINTGNIPSRRQAVIDLEDEKTHDLAPNQQAVFGFTQPFNVTAVVGDQQAALTQYFIRNGTLHVVEGASGTGFALPGNVYVAAEDIPVAGQSVLGFEASRVLGGYRVQYDAANNRVTVSNFSGSALRIELQKSLSSRDFGAVRPDYSQLPKTTDGFIDLTKALVPDVSSVRTGTALRQEIRNHILRYLDPAKQTDPARREIVRQKQRAALSNLDRPELLPLMERARRQNVLLIVSRPINWSNFLERTQGLTYAELVVAALEKMPPEMTWELAGPVAFEVTKTDGGVKGFQGMTDSEVGGGIGMTQFAPLGKAFGFDESEILKTVVHEILGHKRSMSKRILADTWEPVMGREAWIALGKTNRLQRLIPLTEELWEAIEKALTIAGIDSVSLDDLPQDPQKLLDFMRNLFEMPFSYFQSIHELLAWTTMGRDLASLESGESQAPNADHDYAGTRDILRVSNNRLGVAYDPENEVYVSYDFEAGTGTFSKHYLQRSLVNGDEMWREVRREAGGWVRVAATPEIRIPGPKGQSLGAEAAVNTKNQTVLLNLELPAPLRAFGEYQPKEEFHVTLVGFSKFVGLTESSPVHDKKFIDIVAQQLNLDKKAAKDAANQVLTEAVAGINFRVTRSGVFRAVEKAYPNEPSPRRSVVEEVTVDGLDQFFSNLETRLNLPNGTFDRTAAHITLFTSGNAQGIGITSGAELRGYPVAGDELASQVRANGGASLGQEVSIKDLDVTRPETVFGEEAVAIAAGVRIPVTLFSTQTPVLLLDSVPGTGATGVVSILKESDGNFRVAAGLVTPGTSYTYPGRFVATMDAERRELVLSPVSADTRLYLSAEQARDLKARANAQSLGEAQQRIKDQILPFIQGRDNLRTEVMLDAYLRAGDYREIAAQLERMLAENGKKRWFYGWSAEAKSLRAIADNLPKEDSPEVARGKELFARLSGLNSDRRYDETYLSALAEYLNYLNQTFGSDNPYYAQLRKGYAYRAAPGTLLGVIQRYVFDHGATVRVADLAFASSLGDAAVSEALKARPGYVSTLYQVPEKGTDRAGAEGKATLRIFEIFNLELTEAEEQEVIRQIRENPRKHILLLNRETIEKAKAGKVDLVLSADMGIIPSDFVGQKVTIGDNAPAILEGASLDDLTALPEVPEVRTSPAGLFMIKVGDYYLLSLNKNRLKKGKFVATPIGGAYDFTGDAGRAAYVEAGVRMRPEEEKKPNEMRQLVNREDIMKFLGLFNQGVGRETSAVRELREELVGTASEEDVFKELPENARKMAQSLGILQQRVEEFIRLKTASQGAAQDGDLVSAIVSAYYKSPAGDQTAEQAMVDFFNAVRSFGMTVDETVAMAIAIKNSGETAPDFSFLPADTEIYDVASTGGVGNILPTLVSVLATWADPAANKLANPKIASDGRPGTIDTWLAVPGLKTDLPADTLTANLRDLGMFVTGQTKQMAPVDKKMMEARRASKTMDVASLVVASIFGKRISVAANRALGTQVLVFDGRTSKLGKSREETIRATEFMADVAKKLTDLGYFKNFRGVVVNNDIPHSNLIGRAQFVEKIIGILKGERDEYARLAIELAARVLVDTGKYSGDADAMARARSAIEEALRDGRVLERLRDVLKAQLAPGADAAAIDRMIENPQTLYDGDGLSDVEVKAGDLFPEFFAAQETGFVRLKNVSAIDESFGILAGAKPKGDGAFNPRDSESVRFYRSGIRFRSDAEGDVLVGRGGITRDTVLFTVHGPREIKVSRKVDGKSLDSTVTLWGLAHGKIPGFESFGGILEIVDPQAASPSETEARKPSNLIVADRGGSTQADAPVAVSLGAEQSVRDITGLPADALAGEVSRAYERGGIEEVRTVLTGLARNHADRIRDSLKSNSEEYLSKLTAAEDLVRAALDLENDALAAILPAELNNPENRAALAQVLRRAVLGDFGAPSLDAAASRQAADLTEADIRAFDSLIADARDALSPRLKAMKLFLVLSHAGNDMQRVIDSLVEYRDHVDRLVILHTKEQKLSREGLRGFNVVQQVMDPARAEVALKKVDRTASLLLRSGEQPYYVFSEAALNLDADFMNALKPVLTQINNVPEKLKKQVLDAVFLIIFHLALKSADERREILANKNGEFTKFLGDLGLDFLSQGFVVDNKIELSLNGFITSITQAAEAAAAIAKAA
ncbi:MAG: hypothetical protein HY714_01765 [Candidatus Omnitrophica bacterium]|nr:hypothetical protein [Candidatus Omnitrophota bacterium]